MNDERTPLQTAEGLLEEERHEMVQQAKLLHRRLGNLIEAGAPSRGFDLPTIVSMLSTMRDAVESYRITVAVVEALKPLSGSGESHHAG